MPYLLDYLEGQFATFDEAPLNAVDAAVLSQVCMIQGDGVIPELGAEFSAEETTEAGECAVAACTTSPSPMNTPPSPVRLRDLLRAEHFPTMFTGLDPARIKNCLFAVAASPRFRTMTVHSYASEFDVEREVQFAAMTFSQGDEFSVVTFRGTDASRTGWKEDFNMAYSMPVPAQRQALQYLEAVVPTLTGKVYVCGHSKGGNLAEYAALKASPEVQERLELVYILDGPGFKEDFFTPEEYAPAIDRMYKVVPQDSIIGILLESPVPLHVVPSKARGFNQHSVFTWEIAMEEVHIPETEPVEAERSIGLDFIYLEGLSDSAAFVKEALDEWLERYNDVERLILVDVLFRALDASGADDVMDLISGGTRTIELFVEATRNLDEEDKGLLSEAGRDFVETARNIAARKFGENVARSIASGANQVAQGIAVGTSQAAQGIAAGAAQIAQAIEQAAANRRSLKTKE